MSVLSASLMLFLIMDPVGNLPVYMAILKEVPPARRHWIVVRELLMALALMLVFLYFGAQLLEVLHVQQESVNIAGGLVLFLIAIRMIFPGESGVVGDLPEGEPFLVPLAVPFVAGPSTLAALMLLARSHPGRLMDWTMALIAAWLLTALILLCSGLVLRLIGARGVTAMERLMGMVLVMLAVQTFLDGIASYLER
jgi:multiple antibiotic resistance protein